MDHDAEIRNRVEQACVEFERDVRAFLSGILRDVHLVDEAYQKCVVKAIEAAPNVNPEKIRGWLFQIALNEARGLKRSAARQGRLQRAVWETLPPGVKDQPEDSLLRLVSLEEQDAVRAALENLSEDYREVVIRRIHNGQTFAVIAAEMNKPLGTVLTWMRRALSELRDSSELRRHFE